MTALLIVAIGIGIAAHRLPGAERVATFLDRWPQVREMLARLREGLTIATKAGTIGRALVLTLLAWGCSILAFTAGAQAVGIEPTMGQAALLAAGTNLATAIPAAPGYVGTFELAAVTIGASVGISRDDALAMAVLVHGFSLLITSIGGAIAFALGPRRRHAAGRDGRARAGRGRRRRQRPPPTRSRPAPAPEALRGPGITKAPGGPGAFEHGGEGLAT